MSKFFESEIIQKEMRELQEFSVETLLESMYPKLLFGAMSKEEAKEILEKIINHYEKLKVFHTRLVLTDDEDAKTLLNLTEKQYHNVFEILDGIPGAPKTFNDLINSQIKMFEGLLTSIEETE